MKKHIGSGHFWLFGKPDFWTFCHFLEPRRPRSGSGEWFYRTAVKSTALPRGMYACVVSPVVCCWCIMRKIRYLYQIPWYPGNYRKSYHTRRDDGHYSWKDLQVPDFAFDALQLVGTLWKRSPIEIYCLFLLHFCLTPESRVAQCKEALLWALNKLRGFVFTKSCTN